MADRQVGVIGLGLIGSSTARALAAAGWRVVGTDPHADTRSAAAAAGVDLVPQDHDWTDCDLVFLAAPTRANTDLLAGLISAGGGVAVADLGSVKAPIEQRWLDLDPAFPFVGTHPMAGSERAGFASGSADLFHGAPWPVVVHERTDPRALMGVLSAVIATGARPVPVSAAAHDAAVAAVSHLPHLLAGALGHGIAQAPQPGLAVLLAGGSYRDASRVSGSPEERSAEFLALNGAEAARQARLAADALAEAARFLEDGDRAALRDWLAPAGRTRGAFSHRWDAAQSGSRSRKVDGTADSVHRLLLTRRDTGAWVVSLDSVAADRHRLVLAGDGGGVS